MTALGHHYSVYYRNMLVRLWYMLNRTLKTNVEPRWSLKSNLELRWPPFVCHMIWAVFATRNARTFVRSEDSEPFVRRTSRMKKRAYERILTFGTAQSNTPIHSRWQVMMDWSRKKLMWFVLKHITMEECEVSRILNIWNVQCSVSSNPNSLSSVRELYFEDSAKSWWLYNCYVFLMKLRDTNRDNHWYRGLLSIVLINHHIRYQVCYRKSKCWVKANHITKWSNAYLLECSNISWYGKVWFKGF